MYAIAVETSASDATSALAVALRREMAALRPACPEIEKTCLDAGGRLGETVPALSELAELFEDLAGKLSGETFAAASGELGRLTVELSRADEELAQESRTLDRLAEANQEIGKRIEDLLGFTRTMSWLVFTLKVESAPLARLSAGMTAFAEDIHKLAETTRRGLEDYQATFLRLETLLRAARSAQARFLAEHQTRLARAAASLRGDLDAASERRAAAVAGLRRTGAEAREMLGRVGECVAAMQTGDRTRQRVEHAHDALKLVLDTIEGRRATPLRALSAPEVEALTARACLLQARQIQGARLEYAAETAQIVAGLRHLAAESDEWAARGRDVFGAGGGAEASFIAAIESRLIAAREATAHFGGARATVDEAARSVVAIVEDMRQRTTALFDHVVDVTIIGTNALLRSTRLGDQGKGVALIARELRAYGEQTGAIIRSLPEALDGVVDLAAGLSRGGRFDAAAVTELQARMDAAIAIYGASRREIAAALERLAGCADEGRIGLAEACDVLAVSARTDAGLSAAEHELEAIGSAHAGPGRPDLDLVLDAMLMPLYTMDSERQIHAESGGRDTPRAPKPRRAPRSEAEMVEEILL